MKNNSKKVLIIQNKFLILPSGYGNEAQRLRQSYGKEPKKTIAKIYNTVKSTVMKISEIFGITLCSYDSWNGDNNVIKVESISLSDSKTSLIFAGTGYWGNRQLIYVPIDKVDELMEKGRAKESTTIDHCDVTKEWEIRK